MVFPSVDGPLVRVQPNFKALLLGGPADSSVWQVPVVRERGQHGAVCELLLIQIVAPALRYMRY